MERFTVYILKCKDGSYYVGHTDNIEKRMAEHNHGGYSQYTSTRLPVELVFLQHCATRDEAFVAERQVKGWSRKKKEALINNDWSKLSLYAKKKFD